MTTKNRKRFNVRQLSDGRFEYRDGNKYLGVCYFKSDAVRACSQLAKGATKAKTRRKRVSA